MTAVVLLPLIMGRSQEAGAPGQGEPVLAAGQLAAQQARERDALERLHQSELRALPPGLSARELMERQQAEHRAFDEHVDRQHQVFDNRQQSSSSPAAQERSSATTFSQRSATGRQNLR